MVRVTQKRKRSSTSSGRRIKRRRTTRRSRRGVAYTSQRGSAVANQFRSRRTSVRKYRRMIWDSTLFKQHYRSISSQAVTTNTPNNTVQATMNFVKALDNGAGLFWTSGGGTQSVDGGVTVPTFGSTIVVRGGTARITFAHNGTADTDDGVRIRVWAVWTGYEPANFPTPGTVPLEWDPTCHPSFQRNVGKLLYSREAIVVKGGESLTCTHRLRVQKLDKEIFSNNGSTLYWFYTVSQTSNNEAIAAAESVTATYSFNLSFSGDEDST